AVLLVLAPSTHAPVEQGPAAAEVAVFTRDQAPRGEVADQRARGIGVADHPRCGDERVVKLLPDALPGEVQPARIDAVARRVADGEPGPQRGEGLRRVGEPVADI